MQFKSKLIHYHCIFLQILHNIKTYINIHKLQYCILNTIFNKSLTTNKIFLLHKTL